MRATSIGHAGILIETAAGSILCDPWFVPAFFGSWFVFPRNDQLDDELRERIEHADYLYVTHLHADHHDEAWLREHLRRDIPILLPGYPTREQERTLRQLGFTEFIRTTDGEELELAPGLTIAIHVETSITDGPGGDSAMVVSDGRTRLVNQNDCRTSDLDALNAHGPVDLHWLQYSGAIWYPMVYDMPDAEKRVLCEAKVESQFARAMRYVEAIDARAVVPSAGPPVFLDDELFHLNMIRGDELSIFPDQRTFIDRLANAGRHGVLAIPGTTIEISPDAIDVIHPIPAADVDAIYDDKAAYLDRYRADWQGWLDELHTSWDTPNTDLLATLKAWWEPLLAMAPTLRNAVGANCLFRAGDLELVIDFPAGEVRALRRRAPIRSGSRSPATSSRPSWPGAPSTGATRCSCRVASGRGATASSTSTSTTSSSRCRSSACAAPRPRRCGGSIPRPRSNPTSSSATGSCNAGARTATPTSRCSVRSRAASSCARSTAGASTSRRAAA